MAYVPPPNRASRPVTGTVRSVRPGLLSRRRAKIAVTVVIAVLAVAVILVGAGVGRPRHAAKAETKPGPDDYKPVVVKKPLPPDVQEQDVVKWVPDRKVSGRVELEAWQSMDGDIVGDAAKREEILAPKTRPLGEGDQLSAEAPDVGEDNATMEDDVAAVSNTEVDGEGAQTEDEPSDSGEKPAEALKAATH